MAGAKERATDILSLPQVEKGADFLNVVGLIQAECDEILNDGVFNNQGLILFERLGSLIPENTEKVDPNTDLDIECISKTELGSVTQELITNRINQVFINLGKRIPLELFFRTENQFKKGELSKKGKGKLYNLAEGSSSNGDTAQWIDSSLGTVFVYGTMELFSKEDSEGFNRRKQWFDKEVNEAVKKTTLTQLGAIDWTHFYMKSFLNAYHRMDRGSVGYAESISKLLVRIAVGYDVVFEDPNALETVKNNLFQCFQEAKDKKISNDEVIAGYLYNKESKKAASWLSDHFLRLLTEAGSIRSKGRLYNIIMQNDGSRQIFCNEAEQMIINLACQAGTTMRRDEVGDFDLLVGLGIEVLLKHMMDVEVLLRQMDQEAGRKQKEKMIEVVSYPSGTRIIKDKDKSDDWCYFLPQYSKGSFVIDQPGLDVVRSSGRIAGEIRALFNVPRTANVKIESDDGRKVDVYRIRGVFLRELFKDPKVVEGLRNPALIQSQKISSRVSLANLLLNYFTYEFIHFTREIAKRIKEPAPAAAEQEVLAPDTAQPNPLEKFKVENYAMEIKQMFAHHNNVCPP